MSPVRLLRSAVVIGADVNHFGVDCLTCLGDVTGSLDIDLHNEIFFVGIFGRIDCSITANVDSPSRHALSGFDVKKLDPSGNLDVIFRNLTNGQEAK